MWASPKLFESSIRHPKSGVIKKGAELFCKPPACVAEEVVTGISPRVTEIPLSRQQHQP